MAGFKVITEVFVCLMTMLCTGVALAQAAYVYVPTPAGIYAYDASSAGKLTAIKGSPFKQTSGLAIGTNGKFFISLGTEFIHSYAVSSNGAIGAQASQVNTQSYTGVECGTTDGAMFDPTGQYVYVSLNGVYADGDPFCEAFQGFAVAKTTGDLTFKGALVFSSSGRDGAPNTSLPVFAGNDVFAYNTSCCYQYPGDAGFFQGFNAFSRESGGTLEYAASSSETDPTPQVGYHYYPYLVTDDPTDHLAAAVFPEFEPPLNPTGPTQLASYTVGPHGELTSTNTYENMPTVPGGVGAMRMSPSGKLLAIATATGIQVFHFNGANPITEFTGIIGTSGAIKEMQWDTHNHLYGLDSSGKLHVYTATTTSVSEVGGSPYVIPKGAQANGLIVRSIP